MPNLGSECGFLDVPGKVAYSSVCAEQLKPENWLCFQCGGKGHIAGEFPESVEIGKEKEVVGISELEEEIWQLKVGKGPMSGAGSEELSKNGGPRKDVFAFPEHGRVVL